MTSDFQTICDAIASDLVTNVEGLRDAAVHLYAPYDPEQQEADGKHLAIWPQAEDAEAAVPLTTQSRQLVQLYAVLYWEPAGDESSRGVADQQAAADLLTLHNDTRDRFYLDENMVIGGFATIEYQGARLPERSGRVRWFAIALEARLAQDIT